MKKQDGFTLVEMAMVLAIIGLLAGSITLGTTVVRAQQVRQVLEDATTYENAISLFDESYSAKPGDYANATQQWGCADGGTPPANCATPATDTSNGGKPTCNGDGDDSIESANYESFRAWQHMMAAGMITGFYTGVYVTGGTTYAVPGTNSPVSKVKNTTFYIDSYGDLSADANRYDGNYDNVLVYGGTTTNDYPQAVAITGKEAYELDVKEDDGYPGYGDIRSWKPNKHANCATTALSTTSRYNKSYTSDACGLFFLNTFGSEDEES